VKTRRLSRFDTGARVTLVFTSLLLLGSIQLLVLRSTLPTDGWDVTSGAPGYDDAWVYLDNLVGAESQLQTEDILLEVDGVPINGSDLVIQAVSQNWQVGNSVSMTVLRGDTQLTVDVPVVHWTLQAVLHQFERNPAGFLALLGSALLGLVGFYTFLQRPELPSTRALLVLSTTNAAMSISSILPDGLSSQFNTLAWLEVSLYNYAAFGILLAPSLFAFTLHFPNTKAIIRKYPLIGYVPLFISLIVAVAVYVFNVGIIGWFATMGLFAATIISMIHAGFTQRDTVSRAQMRWVIGGFVVAMGFALLTFLSAFQIVTAPFWSDLLSGGLDLAFPIIGLSLAVAVLRYRLFDIDVIIRRTLTYALVTLLLGLVYFGSITLLQTVIIRVTGEESTLAIVITTLLIAALFSPVRSRVQTIVDKRFFRSKYDAQQTLDTFSQYLQDEVDLDQMTTRLVSVVESTLQPSHMAVWVKPVEKREKVSWS